MKHDAFFRKHPVFTVEELSRHLASQREVGPRAREALLAYHAKVGRLVQVRRGLYAVVPPSAYAGSHPIDPFLVAAKLTPDAVLSYHTALAFHGRAYAVWEHVVYSTAHPTGPLNFRSHVFRGTRFPKALIREGKVHVGVSTAERSGLEIRVTNLERTLVDVLDRPDLAGTWEEIWRSLESVEFFDLDDVVEYTRLLGNATTAAKAGFFLEQHRESLMVEDHYLQNLQDLRPRQPHYLDRARRGAVRLVSRWNLVVPEELLERAWEEVL